MGKSFKKNDPNLVLSGTTQHFEPTEKPQTAAVEPTRQNPPEQTKSKDKDKKKKYLRLDITAYQDYISLMSTHLTATSGKYVSMTQYILDLIEADKQRNSELFEKLEQIENMKRELI